MPELPEVETIRRQLEPELVGNRIDSVEVHDDYWTKPEPPADLIRALEGRTVEAVTRRGKYLIIGMDGEVWLVMHLRMTGNILIGQPSDGSGVSTEAPPRLGMDRLYEGSVDLRHLKATITLEDGRAMLFTDPRRFGRGYTFQGAAMREYIDSRVGVEPLSDEFTPEVLGRIAEGRQMPLKSFLLTQDGVAGVGNIYADEALHRAELHPLSPAGSMRSEHHEALHAGVVEALEAGLSNGGASIDDYRDARGEQGSMQDEFLVHTREGEDCPRCTQAIKRIVVSGRSTYFCPACQVRLRKRRKTAKRKARS